MSTTIKYVMVTLGIALVVSVIVYVFMFNNEEASAPAGSIDQSSSDNKQVKETNKTEIPITASAKLKAVGDYTGTGIATRVYENGLFTHTVTADLQEPSTGKFYEGWLINGNKFFPTGKLEKSNNEYKLKFEDDKNYPAYKKVVITEETENDGLDGKPETHVLEGTF